MAKRISRRLVIDASVARAAGSEEASFPTSKHCRDCLMAVLTICHRVIMTRPILNEWKKHRSKFAGQWRASMVARKKIGVADTPADQELRSSLRRLGRSDRESVEMLKDAHLLEAALVADATVISLDDEARTLFAHAAQSIAHLGSIMWANPNEDSEAFIQWLEAGAHPEKSRQLRSYKT